MSRLDNKKLVRYTENMAQKYTAIRIGEGIHDDFRTFCASRGLKMNYAATVALKTFMEKYDDVYTKLHPPKPSTVLNTDGGISNGINSGDTPNTKPTN